MGWTQRASAVARRVRFMQDHKGRIQAGLDKGHNKAAIAANMRIDKGELTDFIIDNRMRAFSDLGYQFVSAVVLKGSGGHFHKNLEPIMFKKRQGWFCILQAYKVRSLITAAGVAEQEVVKLQAEIASLKALIEEGQGGVP